MSTAGLLALVNLVECYRMQRANELAKLAERAERDALDARLAMAFGQQIHTPQTPSQSVVGATAK